MSGFANTDLDAQLKQRGIENVILVGFVANTCIEATARFGMELGYHVTLIKDATAAFSQEGMPAAHEVIRVGADPTVWPVDRRMRPLVAHGQAGLADVYGRTGRHTEAEEHLRRATSLYEAMEMRFWLARAEEATRDQAPRRTR
jgi:hypothetical protein